MIIKQGNLFTTTIQFDFCSGSQGTCSCHALGKSVVDGFQRGIFVPGRAVDFNQEAVIHVLLNEYKVSIDKVVRNVNLHPTYELISCFISIITYVIVFT